MLLVRKIGNAGELLWDSLDTQERAIVLYVGVVVLAYVLGAARRRGHERLIAELRDELEAAPRGRD